MKKIKLWMLSIIIVTGLILIISSIMYSPEYMYRILKYGDSDINDMFIFNDREINNSLETFEYIVNKDNKINEIQINDLGTIEDILNESATTSFLVIHKDKVVYEKYFKGASESSLNTSFSSVKSIVSLLIGIAVDEGLISSEKDQIEKYIVELKDAELGQITIEELLLMRSPIKYKEGLLWFGDDALTYYSPDLRNLAINTIKIDRNFNRSFHYNNYHPLLLGIILERSTGKSVSEYFEEKIWTQIGTKYKASWSLDSQEHRFEKMESGLNFRTIDMAKLGSMLMYNGEWNENVVVSKKWLEKSLYPMGSYNPDEYKNSFLEGKETDYQYMWYSVRNEIGLPDFYAAGKYGQLLYVSPVNEVVIVRTGSDVGNIEWWPDLLKEVSSKVSILLDQ